MTSSALFPFRIDDATLSDIYDIRDIHDIHDIHDTYTMNQGPLFSPTSFDLCQVLPMSGL